ncbi:uncharacterized protein LOC113358678 isoform X2 [Papaver somniferum]|uniref:uncharacterized protein LOC113358678 isoform X2 n=1 Tax=Papaver somniferum TaxID=3469 RepID=UPI000E6FC700|nr:uncharacterized protein LOC113358678 isoform X2 [Papaver somniferum]
MTCIKEDQYPKAIKEANEIGGPAVVMRFLNDPKVLQKLGDGMGFGTSGDVVNPTEYGLYSVPYDNAEDKSSKEGTSIVHRTSGVGDTEEMDRLPKEERVTEERKMSKNQWSNRRKKLKKAHERRTALAAQFPIVEELEIGNLQHDFSADPISTSISEEGLEELMSCDKKDPYLKPIVEDIEIGGPTVMMRYLNDPEVLQKLGQAMGFGLSGEIVDATKHNAPADYAKSKTAKESDSVVFAGNKGNRRHNEATTAKPINFYRFCYNCCEGGHKTSQCPIEKVQAADKRDQTNTWVLE